MNGQQLAAAAAAADSATFLGVFAQDELPQQQQLPAASFLIVNTDPSSKPGEHWILLWWSDEERILFDSYGLLPSKWYPNIMIGLCNEVVVMCTV